MDSPLVSAHFLQTSHRYRHCPVCTPGARYERDMGRCAGTLPGQKHMRYRRGLGVRRIRLGVDRLVETLQRPPKLSSVRWAFARKSLMASTDEAS